jgi:hypothetical protein
MLYHTITQDDRSAIILYWLYTLSHQVVVAVVVFYGINKWRTHQERSRISQQYDNDATNITNIFHIVCLPSVWVEG